MRERQRKREREIERQTDGQRESNFFLTFTLAKNKSTLNHTQFYSFELYEINDKDIKFKIVVIERNVIFL